MRACFCCEFDEAAAGEAIKSGEAEHPEDVHRLVKGREPNCGSCLSRIQSMVDKFNETGAVPRILDITREDQQEAEAKLKARFTQEEPDPAEAPRWKLRYMVDKGPRRG